MPTFILMHEHNGQRLYHEYSTVVDAPVSAAMTEDEFRRYYRGDNLDERLARTNAHGHSAYRPTTFEEEISCNRAGPGESCLGVDAYKALVVAMREQQGLPPLPAPATEDEVQDLDMYLATATRSIGFGGRIASDPVALEAARALVRRLREMK